MKKYLLFSFNFIGKIGFSVAVPLVAFAFLGRYLDRHFNLGHPYFFLSGIVVATIIVYFILRKMIKDTIEEFDNLSKTNDK